MVRCNRISIPDAYIIEDANDKKRHKNDYHTIDLPVEPALDVYPWPDKPEEVKEYQSKVIIIEL